jgi:hypothetical protein
MKAFFKPLRFSPPAQSSSVIAASTGANFDSNEVAAPSMLDFKRCLYRFSGVGGYRVGATEGFESSA